MLINCAQTKQKTHKKKQKKTIPPNICLLNNLSILLNVFLFGLIKNLYIKLKKNEKFFFSILKKKIKIKQPKL